MAAKNLLSFPRRAWVIPNGSGMLWTDRIFDTEAEAQAHVDAYWAESGWTTPKHKPIEASVRVTAKLALLTQEESNG